MGTNKSSSYQSMGREWFNQSTVGFINKYIENCKIIYNFLISVDMVGQMVAIGNHEQQNFLAPEGGRGKWG